MTNEPYTEYLGVGYTVRVRKFLTVDDKICTDTMINSTVAIGGMKKMIEPYLKKIVTEGKGIQKEADYAVFQQAALYFLAGILCGSIMSRAKVPPFLGYKYQKNWKKKQEHLMKKGHLYLNSLLFKEESTEEHTYERTEEDRPIEIIYKYE